ncbi:hypothetical protein ACNOYE_21055 [Nannocystaceae bacterium ST9]
MLDCNSRWVPLVLITSLACNSTGGDAGDELADDTTGDATSGVEAEDTSTSASDEADETDETSASDSTTGDSTTGDSTTGDEGGDPASCVGSSASFCEDFEQPDALAGWGLHVGGHTLSAGDVERDATHGRGEGALHSWIDSEDNLTAWGWIERPVEVTEPDLFVRSYVYVPADSITNWFALVALWDADGYAALGLGLEGDTLSTIGWGDTHEGVLDSQPFPTDQWVCLEFQLHQAEDAWFSAWRDEVMFVDQTPVTLQGPVLDTIFFGLYGGNNDIGLVFDVWIDDIAIDDAPIGCP